MNDPRIMTSEEYQKMSEEGLTNFTIDGKCSGCGGCCSDRLPLTNGEIGKIRKFIQTERIQPISQYPVAVMSNPPINMICPFRCKEKGCIIYPVRPWACREFLCSNSDTHINDKLMERLQKEKGDVKTVKIYSMRQIIFHWRDKKGKK